MTTFRASAARARRGVRDRLPAKRRAVPANKKVEPRAALARLLLPLLILPATLWAQGADEPAEAHAFAIGLDGADALPGPATIIPFQMCALWGALNSSIDPDQDTAPIHAWGKKMWRRALTDAQLRDIFQTDLAALKAKGLAGGKATNRKSRIVNRESAHPKPLAVPRAPVRPNLPKSAQSAFSPVVPSAAADP